MKKIFKFALASVAVAFAGFGVYQNMPQEKTLSDFALENIEALTNDEHTRCDESECKLITREDIICYFYILNSHGTIVGIGEKSSYAYDPYNYLN